MAAAGFGFMRLLFACILLFLFQPIWAKLRPAEGRALNSVMVAFQEQGKFVAGCTLQVARGRFNDDESFTAHIVLTKQMNAPVVVARLPDFGQEYTWRVVVTGSSDKSIFHHFSIGTSKYLDTNLYRIRVTNNSNNHGFVMLDGPGLICDGEGKPIWYFPLGQLPTLGGTDLRDMKMTWRGTITCLFTCTPYEINWTGDVLWKKTDSNKNGLLPQYHHDFTLLKNGHYMVLGNEDYEGPLHPEGKVQFGTVLEYDLKGKLISQWRSSALYLKTKYNYPHQPLEPYDVHANAFYYDAGARSVYVGFKNISQIVKVQFPGGKILGQLGMSYDGPVVSTTAPFYEQHSISRTSDGLLCIFDNHNTDKTGARFLPHFMLLKEETTGGHLTAHMVWEYTYPKCDRRLVKPDGVFTNGGSAYEISPGTFLVSMCSPFGNVFIVNRNRQLLWEAVTEEFAEDTRSWKPSPQYRASYIPDMATLEQMVIGTTDK
ncbi:MAG: hypothetical protein EBZ77_00335 [Chitinophagia bacterium]|nr:hypothetical protein [Chitinophagia bacterium]